MVGIARQSIAGVSIGNTPIGSFNPPDAQEPFNFPAGASYTFSPPVDGYWKFVGWGPGGTGSSTAGSASGGYTEITRRLSTTDTVTIAPGVSGSTATATTITLPGGVVVTAGAASGATPGTASGGDVNLSGTAGTSGTGATGGAGAGTGGGAGGAGSGSNDGGAGAPANLPYRGGKGGPNGAGGSANGFGAGGGGTGNASLNLGGPGAVIATLVRS